MRIIAEVTTVTGFEDKLISDPSIEVVYRECSTGETYTSQKFRRILGAIGFINENKTDEIVSLQISTTTNQVTVRINGSDTSDLKVTMILFGEP